MPDRVGAMPPQAWRINNVPGPHRYDASVEEPLLIMVGAVLVDSVAYFKAARRSLCEANSIAHCGTGSAARWVIPSIGSLLMATGFIHLETRRNKSGGSPVENV